MPLVRVVVRATLPSVQRGLSTLGVSWSRVKFVKFQSMAHEVRIKFVLLRSFVRL
jgi:hypothetical protein